MDNGIDKVPCNRNRAINEKTETPFCLSDYSGSHNIRPPLRNGCYICIVLLNHILIRGVVPARVAICRGTTELLITGFHFGECHERALSWGIRERTQM